MDSTTYALPATPKQIAYARSLALRNQTLLPWEVQQDRRSLSAWIEAQALLKPVSDMDRLPTSKQVAFAEKLARIKRRAVPDDRGDKRAVPWERVGPGPCRGGWRDGEHRGRRFDVAAATDQRSPGVWRGRHRWTVRRQ